MKLISCPTHLMTFEEIKGFWKRAGYRVGKDFKFVAKNNSLFIQPKTQMILAQDSLKLGFKKVDIK